MTKSENYQYRYLEIGVNPEKLQNIGESISLGTLLGLQSENEEIRAIREVLLKRVIKLIDEKVTPYQRRVLMLTLSGKTQEEIGKELNITQSAVHKSLHGNITYPARITYGGSIKKLKKICQKDEVILKLLEEIKLIKKADIKETVEFGNQLPFMVKITDR